MKNIRVWLQGFDLPEKETRIRQSQQKGVKFGLVATKLRKNFGAGEYGYCECCGNKSEEELYPCEICGDLIGECCKAPHNVHSQITYTLCTYCNYSKWY